MADCLPARPRWWRQAPRRPPPRLSVIPTTTSSSRARYRTSAIVQRAQAVSPELARIREQQRIFLRANQKFPDYIDVGIGVWESVYDWHVRHQQPLTIAGATGGRYVMTVMFTTLILRPEQDANYVGFGFDAR